MNTKDRYITFENIDCYNDAKSVLDAMYELFTLKPESKNEFWERFEGKLPDDYANTPFDELGRDTLYQVCSNVFYIEDLFEKYEFEKGLDFLKTTEFDCC
ncbi:N(2)-fixation sustaining protein CowN [bacterium]|nr:N(2)-fixation sustaining protein CowN [bacterium]MBU1883697.1 N(2)-fixation sustaining protein CowN [bacterium]